MDASCLFPEFRFLIWTVAIACLQSIFCVRVRPGAQLGYSTPFLSARAERQSGHVPLHFRVYADMECSAFILTPQAVRAPKPSSGLLAWRLIRTSASPDASLACVRERKNGEADNVQTDSLHSASRASRKAPHPLLRFSSQNRNDVSVLKGRAAERTRPRVLHGGE